MILVLFSGGLLENPAYAAAQQQSGSVQITVDPGFGGYFRPRAWTPVRITLHNSGAPIEGSVRISSDAGGVNGNTFSTPISLSTGAEKVITLEASFEINVQRAQADLIDANGAVVGSASAPVTLIDAGDALYGLISGATSNTIALTDAHQSTSTAYLVTLTADTVPDSASALDSLNALIFSSTDSGRLSSAQRAAIGDWMRNGGRLIVIGGTGWQTTAAGLDALLPFHPTGSGTIDGLDALSGFITSAAVTPTTGTALGGQTIVAQGTVDPAARVLITQASQPLLIERAAGSGAVDYLTFDPNLTPFRAWANRAAFWQQLLIADAPPRPGWANGLVIPDAGLNAAALLVGVQLPQVAVVAGFLLLYIFLIGPLNYLILRRLRRLEWAWFTIPALIAIATVGAYLIGLSLRGTQPILTRLSVVQVWPGQDRARVDGVIGLTAPQQGRFDLRVDSLSLQPLTLGAIAGLFNGSGGLNLGETVIGTPAGGTVNRRTISNLALASEVTKAFVVTGTVPAPSLSGTANVVINADGSLTLSGQITNGTPLPLDNIDLILLDTAFPLNPIAAGQTENFSFPLNPPMRAVAAVTPMSQMSGNQSTPFMNGFHPPMTSALGLLMNSIPAQTNVSGADVINLTDRRVQARRVDLLNAYVRSDELGGGRGLQVSLIGWQNSAPFQAALNVSDIRTESDTLDVVALTTHLSRLVSSVVLTPGYFAWQSLDVSTLAGLPGNPSNGGFNSNPGTADPYSLYLQSNAQAAFEFVPRPGLNVKQVTNLSLFGQVINTGSGILSLWDWSANTWVTVARPDPTLAAPEQYSTTDPADLARFVGPGGRVRVLASATDVAANFSRLDVTLGAALDIPTGTSAP